MGLTWCSRNGQRINLSLQKPLRQPLFHSNLGLPQAYEKNRLKIGLTLGKLVPINSKMVVRQHFLRLRVDVTVNTLLAAIFKHANDSPEEILMRFRYKKVV